MLNQSSKNNSWKNNNGSIPKILRGGFLGFAVGYTVSDISSNYAMSKIYSGENTTISNEALNQYILVQSAIKFGCGAVGAIVGIMYACCVETKNEMVTETTPLIINN